MNHTLRNLLGAIRAESDNEMLKAAFIETPDYKAIIETSDFNFIVGRRGTGKSALKIAAYRNFYNKKGIWVFDVIHNDYDALKLQSTLQNITDDYRDCRHIVKTSSRAAFLALISSKLKTYYKRNKILNLREIENFCDLIKCTHETSFMSICNYVIHESATSGSKANDIPYNIASKYKLETIEKLIFESLIDLKINTIFLFDRLDEGWTPKKIDTAIIGGITHTAAEYKDKNSTIHAYMFVRDNMFRALASFDNDFTRNIECTSLRLKWQTDSLYELVTQRIRAHFNIDIESNTKVWNRYAKNNLSGRKGFHSCLGRTLYRPRDIISLLNQSFAIALKCCRHEIIEQDVEEASLNISQDRLKDLTNEYETVFPSIDILISSFYSSETPLSYQDTIDIIDKNIYNQDLLDRKSSDFAILETGELKCKALFSIGFIGFQKENSTNISFCHDGSSHNYIDLKPNTNIWVHPCYWTALDIKPSHDIYEVAERIYDDYEPIKNKIETQDIRTKQLGQVLSDLDNIPEGLVGSHTFEEWVLRAIKILFSNKLSNPELHPNADAIARRDIIATTSDQKGFWSRVLNDYKSRQIVFETKNYAEINQTDIRQLCDYLSGNYGRIGIIVNRSDCEGLTTKERGWISRAFHEHNKLIFTIPTSILSRCIRKQRNPEKFDYTDDTLSKRLDKFERNYVNLRH